MNGRILSVVGAMLALTVCSKGNQSSAAPAAAPTSAPSNTPPPAAPAASSAAGGTITGKIKFTGTAPRNPAIDMSEEAACKAKYKTTPTEENVVAGPANALGNVFVYVKSGVPAGQKFTAPTTPAVINQDGCRYHPHVFGIMVGQPFEIDNSDPVLHNIKAIAKNNRPFNVSQPSAGMKTTRPPFTAPEVMVNLECNVHGWMHAYLGVRPDPFYAVSKDDGSFTISGLPPGTYTIEAWHEKFGTQTATVTIAGTESKAQNFTFAAH